MRPKNTSMSHRGWQSTDGSSGWFGGRCCARIGNRKCDQFVALLDGPQTLDTFRVTFSPQAVYQPLGEKRMDDPSTLVEFVQQAQSDFPANHYYLIVADHANGVQGIAWDTTTDPSRRALLTPSEIRQALVAITETVTSPLISSITMVVLSGS